METPLLNRPKRRLLYHNYLFLFGFLYYLIIPLIFVQFGYAYEMGFASLDDYNYERFSNKYLFICVILLISFYIGSRIGAARKWKTAPRENYLTLKKTDRLLYPIFLFAIIWASMKRGYLFNGYMGDMDAAVTGPIATAQLLFMFWLVYFQILYKKISRLICISVVLFSVILLGMGTRMYVLIPCIAVLLYFLEYKVVSVKKILIVFSIFVLLFLAVGILRFGNEVTMAGLLYIGFAEPCFTWLSAESMFHYTREFDLFSFPSNYFTSVYNFIPTFIFPNKGDYIVKLSLPFDAPAGATNLLVSLICNFGVVGSCIFMALIGWLLSYVRKCKTGVFGTTFYICVCSIIPFTFFRDGLIITNKVVIMNMLIVPLAIRYASKILYRHRPICKSKETKEN